MKPTPSISPVVHRGERPLWSVMIPTYRPDPKHLRETLESVLTQAPAPEQMQIAIVDDHHPCDTVARAAREAGPRVEFYRREQNSGMARNWNWAIELARGQWVHLLHQDDFVLPGFYRTLRAAIESHHELGAAYVQHYLIDEKGRRRRLMSRNPATQPGVLGDWLEYVFVQLSFQTPAIVVKRAVYEELGGFREDLPYALDWDMWKRIAARYPIWFDPEPLACYRRHLRAASVGFFASGENMANVRKSIEISKTYLPPEQARTMEVRALSHYARVAVDTSLHALFALKDPHMAWVQMVEARRFRTETNFIRLVVEHLFAAMERWRRDR